MAFRSPRVTPVAALVAVAPHHARAADAASGGSMAAWIFVAALGGLALVLAVALYRERRRAAGYRARLVRSETRFRDFFENAPAMMFLKDLSGRYVDINREYQRVFGIDRDEAVGRIASEVHPGPVGWEIEADDLNLIATGGSAARERAFPAPDGMRQHRGVKFPLRGPDGRIVGIAGLFVDVTELIRARDRAEQAERRLADAIETFPGAFALFDSERRLVACNSSYRNMAAIGREKAIPGVTYREILRAAIDKGYAPEAAGREEDWIEDRVMARLTDEQTPGFRDLNGRWWRALDRTTADGGLTAVRIDITELKAQTEALAAARAQIENVAADLRAKTDKLEQIVRLSAIGGWETEAESLRLWLDEIALRVIDAPLGTQFENEEAMELYTPESRERVRAVSRACLERGAPFDIEADLISLKGERKTVRLLGEPGRAGVRITRIHGVIQDVTELKRKEAALRVANVELRAALAAQMSAESRLADIARVSPDWFWEQNADLAITYMSDGFHRTLGIETRKMIGLTPWLMADQRPEIRASFDMAALERTYAAREPIVDLISLAFDSEGNARWIRTNGAPFYDDEGRFAGYRGVGADVTRLYEAMRAAEAASKAKSAFLATMSHEIRTPMNGVLGVAEELALSVEDPAQRRLVETIRESGETLLHILNDVLDFSKIEAGKLELEAAAFSPAVSARRVAALHELKAAEKGLAFRLRATPETERARIGDSLRVQQVLHNLIGNAVKFTEVGSVDLSLSVDAAGRVVFEIRDTGVGMTAEESIRIFEGFAQADGSTARRFGGTGLGMSITRSLVALMGGEIEVESRPGAGTTARVRLPLASAPEAERSEAVTAPAPPPPGLRILAVDDNATNRMLIDLMLKRAKAQTTIVEGGREAVAAMEAALRGEAAGFDLILMDIAMPEMDGVEALAAIRRAEAAAGTTPVPAVAVTANAMTHQVEDYLNRGFVGHVAKPLQSEALLAAVAAALSRGEPGEVAEQAEPARRAGQPRFSAVAR